MGDPNTGEIYRGALRKEGDVPLSETEASKLEQLTKQERIAELQNLKESLVSQAPTQGICAIDDDLTNTKVVLWEMIQAHQKSPVKSRERSLLITKLQEARMWADEAMAQS